MASILGTLQWLQPVLFKLDLASESLGKVVKAQVPGWTAPDPDSVGLG